MCSGQPSQPSHWRNYVQASCVIMSAMNQANFSHRGAGDSGMRIQVDVGQDRAPMLEPPGLQPHAVGREHELRRVPALRQELLLARGDAASL